MHLQAFCSYPWTRCRVTCEGNISMCCFMRPDPQQPESEAYIGNVLEKSFDEIWFGEIAESIRKDTLEGRVHKKCQTPGCPYNSMSAPYPKQKFVYNEYPVFLEIDLPNTHCNVGGLSPNQETSPACIMCERAAPFFRPEKDHLFEVIDRIKNIVPNLNQIHIQGIAEPFYETRKSGHLLFDLLDAVDFDKHAHKITISVTTNGTLMKRNVRQEYLNRIPHSITNFSIDASTPETFKRIRIFDCFDKVLENLYAFAEERVVARQFLRINTNVNTLNVHEVLGIVDIAHKANVNHIEFSPTDGFLTEIFVNEENCGMFAKAHQDIVERCQKLGVSHSFIRPLDLGMMDRLVQITL